MSRILFCVCMSLVEIGCVQNSVLCLYESGGDWLCLDLCFVFLYLWWRLIVFKLLFCVCVSLVEIGCV